MNFFYRAFGLIIESQCECPELIRDDGLAGADVQVKWGVVPEHLDNSVLLGDWVEGCPQRLLFRIAGVGRYLIENGSGITIQPNDSNVSIKDIRLYLLGSAMGAMLHQRGILPFHGSSIGTDKYAVTFSGPSGIGKSTLAAAMLKQGFHLLADDVSAISFTTIGQPMTNSGMPQVKLHNDAMLQLGRDSSQLELLGNYTEKYGCPEHQAFITYPLPSRTIYILKYHAENHFKNIPLKGMDKFHALRVNTYRPSFVKAMSGEQQHFELIRQLAEHVDAHLLLRPAEGFLINELADYVSQLINK